MLRLGTNKSFSWVGLTSCPYELPLEAWVDDITTWPPLEFPDIVLYLITTPGEFTRERLKAYKSLEAYNYFASGWVGTCYIYSVNSEFCVLKAGVRSSQRTTDPPHRPWVYARRMGVSALVIALAWQGEDNYSALYLEGFVKLLAL